LTVQELLAHASPEMTLRYAKLLDDTKRKAFESVINKGVFSFDLNGEVQEVKAGEDIPQNQCHLVKAQSKYQEKEQVIEKDSPLFFCTKKRNKT
jgi:hypothetical protein